MLTSRACCLESKSKFVGCFVVLLLWCNVYQSLCGLACVELGVQAVRKAMLIEKLLADRGD